MRKLMIVPALTVLALAPAAAQDVVYRFEQRVAPPGQGDVFTLPVPPPGAGAMIEHRMGLLAVEPFDMAAPMTGAPYTAGRVSLREGRVLLPEDAVFSRIARAATFRVISTR